MVHIIGVRVSIIEGNRQEPSSRPDAPKEDSSPTSNWRECCADTWQAENISERGADGLPMLPASCMLEGAESPMYGPTNAVPVILKVVQSRGTWPTKAGKASLPGPAVGDNAEAGALLREGNGVAASGGWGDKVAQETCAVPLLRLGSVYPPPPLRPQQQRTQKQMVAAAIGTGVATSMGAPDGAAPAPVAPVNAGDTCMALSSCVRRGAVLREETVATTSVHGGLPYFIDGMAGALVAGTLGDPSQTPRGLHSKPKTRLVPEVALPTTGDGSNEEDGGANTRFVPDVALPTTGDGSSGEDGGAKARLVPEVALPTTGDGSNGEDGGAKTRLVPEVALPTTGDGPNGEGGSTLRGTSLNSSASTPVTKWNQTRLVPDVASPTTGGGPSEEGRSTLCSTSLHSSASTPATKWNQTRLFPEVALATTGDGPNGEGGGTLRGTNPTSSASTPVTQWHQTCLFPEVALPTTGDGPNAERESTLRGASPTSSGSSPATKWHPSTLRGGTDAAPPPAVVSGYIVGGAQENKPIMEFSMTSRGLVDGLAAAMMFLFTYRRIRWRNREHVRGASSLRLAKANNLRLAEANQTLARFVIAAVHRHRAAKKAVIYLQALARGAAARRCLRRLAHKRTSAILVQVLWRAHAATRRYRAKKTAALAREAFFCRAAARHHLDCLARRARIVLARWRAHSAIREHQAIQTAARHHLDCLTRRARVMLTLWRAHTANSHRVDKTASIAPEAFARGASGRSPLPLRIEVSDMAQAASLDVTGSLADASGVRDANATGGLSSSPGREPEGELGPSRTHEESQAATSKGPSNVEKCRKRRERNRLKREAKGHDRASKAGHKPPTYSSDRFNDKLLNAGRGGASSGVSVGDDAPQDTVKGHSCTAEPSTAARETTGAVLVEETEQPRRKCQPKHVRGTKKPDLMCFTVGREVQHQSAGSMSVGSTARGFSGGTPRLGHGGSATDTPPSCTGPGARACAPEAKAKIKIPGEGMPSGRSHAAGAFAQIQTTGGKMRPGKAPAVGASAQIKIPGEGMPSGRSPAAGAFAQIQTPGGRVGSGRTPAAGASAQIKTPGGGVRSGRTPAAGASGMWSGRAPASEGSAQSPGLTMVDRLLESRKPAILGANAWFGGAYRLEVDPDGNCFGTAWMVSSLVWAVQTRGTLNSFMARLKEAAMPGGAFRTIGVDYQRYTDRFITYVDELKLTWDRPEPEHGISLAVRVVRDLRGPSKAGCGREQEEGGEPAWLQLKWGIALAARAFDVATAPTNLSVADMTKLRQMGESVEFNVGMAHAVSASLPKAGEAADTPVDDAVRPGRGLSLVVGVVVAVLTPDSVRPTEGTVGHATPDEVRQEIDRRLKLEDYTEYYCGLTNDRRVSGLALVKGGTPHYDVLAAAGTRLAKALASSFGVGFGEAEALQELKDQMKSQQKTTSAELEALISPEELEQQAKIWKELQGRR